MYNAPRVGVIGVVRPGEVVDGSKDHAREAKRAGKIGTLPAALTTYAKRTPLI